MGRLYAPPSNPRLDGQRIYTSLQKYPSFIHRPALGWTVKESLSSVVMTNRKCTRNFLLRDCQHSRNEVGDSFETVGDPIVHLRRYTHEKCLSKYLLLAKVLPDSNNTPKKAYAGRHPWAGYYFSPARSRTM